MSFQKIELLDVRFNIKPDIHIRLPDYEADTKKIISKDGEERSLYEDKILYPFLLKNDVIVTVFTDILKFSFKLPAGYVYNGADIPHPLEYFVGSREDIRFLQGALVHDYMLEFKAYIFNQVLNGCFRINEYIRLTSLIFRHVIKEAGTNTILANVMSWCVDIYQKTINRKAWDTCNEITKIKTPC